MKEYILDLIKYLKKEDPDKIKLSKYKIKLCEKHKIKKIPTDTDIIINAENKDIPFLKKYLIRKPVRSISGVSIVAIMSKPYSCPHGACITCPGGPNSEFGNIPQSYTGHEPASMRGLRANFDPYIQVFNRLEQYVVSGHPVGKVELIVMGGTFPSFPWSYQKKFVREAFQAMNDFSKIFFKNKEINFKKIKEFFELPGEVGDPQRTKNIHAKIKKLKQKTELEKEKKKNEKSNVRCVALTIETRPDYCTEKEVKKMRELGCTRVELGLQSIYDNILEAMNRGHTVKQTIDAIKILKENLLKVTLHIMPGLPKSSKNLDIEMFKILFEDENFKPDAIKIYPCMVLPGTKLYKMYKKGKFKPLSTEEAAEIIVEGKKIIPQYCRIMRIQRDIPTKVTSAGVGMTNLRQYIGQKYKFKCNCIRCREPKNKEISWENVKLKKIEYQASGKKEIFLSYEDTKNDILLGFLRLRINSGIREIHVYGQSTSLKTKGSVQHRGLGKKLVNEAHKLAKEHGMKKLKVISGIGVREYYRKLGYKKSGEDMIIQLP